MNNRTLGPEAVFNFVERLYTDEMKDSRFHFECAHKYPGSREGSLHNAKVCLQNAKKIRDRLNVMRGLS